MSIIRVTSCEQGSRAEALAILFGNRPPAQRSADVAEVLQAAEQGEIDLEGLLVARLDGRAVGAVLYLVQTGRTAMVWPPCVLRGEVDAELLADTLMVELRRRLGRSGTRVGQCLIGPEERDDAAVMERNSFPRLATLLYLQRTLSDPLPPLESRRLEAIEFDEASNRRRFEELLDRTYEGTLDCPELNGIRRGADSLANHRLSGSFAATRWRLYRLEGRDAGVLLLTDHPEVSSWEVVYVGVAPEMRGRAIAREMLLEGLHRARQAGRETMLLAVDSRNRYAVSVYEALGFVELGQRDVHLWLSETAE
ncbi:MAG: GNAT family N-acetyltransferase [Planctomycetes bacterium]|nr:GNAT family N-acetyltransferase [Planctomycetota bacterium]